MMKSIFCFPILPYFDCHFTCLSLDFSFSTTTQGKRLQKRNNFVAVEMLLTTMHGNTNLSLFKIADTGVATPAVQGWGRYTLHLLSCFLSSPLTHVLFFFSPMLTKCQGLVLHTPPSMIVLLIMSFPTRKHLLCSQSK